MERMQSLVIMRKRQAYAGTCTGRAMRGMFWQQTNVKLIHDRLKGCWFVNIWDRSNLKKYNFYDLFNLAFKSETLCLIHRRTGNFLPGRRRAVNHLPKKFSQVAQIFTKRTVDKKRGPYGATTLAVLTYGGGSITVTVFQEHNYVAIDKHLEKLPPQFY